MLCFMSPKLFAAGSCARLSQGILRFQTGQGLGRIQFTYAEHLRNLGAKKRRFWMGWLRFLDLQRGQERAQLCRGTGNRPFAGIWFIQPISCAHILSQHPLGTGYQLPLTTGERNLSQVSQLCQPTIQINPGSLTQVCTILTMTVCGSTRMN